MTMRTIPYPDHAVCLLCDTWTVGNALSWYTLFHGYPSWVIAPVCNQCTPDPEPGGDDLAEDTRVRQACKEKLGNVMLLMARVGFEPPAMTSPATSSTADPN